MSDEEPCLTARIVFGTMGGVGSLIYPLTELCSHILPTVRLREHATYLKQYQRGIIEMGYGLVFLKEDYVEKGKTRAEEASGLLDQWWGEHFERRLGED